MSIAPYIKTYSCDVAIVTSIHGIDYGIIAKTKNVMHDEISSVEAHSLPSIFPPGLHVKFALRTFYTPKRLCVSLVFKADKDEFGRERFCALSVLLPRDFMIFCLDPRKIFDQLGISWKDLKDIKTKRQAVALENKIKDKMFKVKPMTEQEILNYSSLLHQSSKKLLEVFNEKLELFLSELLSSRHKLIISASTKTVNLETIWANNSSIELISSILTVLPPPLRMQITFSSIAYDTNSEISRIIFVPPEFIVPRDTTYSIFYLEGEERKIRTSKEAKILAKLIEKSADELTEELELLHLLSLSYYLTSRYKKQKEFSRFLELIRKLVK